jgi:hypothetical protein
VKKEGQSGFKTCLVCRFNWPDRNHFIEDPDIELVGYQVHFRDLDKGLFIFNHHCKTSLAVPVGLFKDLHEGPIFKKSMTGTDECPEFCLRESELKLCPVECECAFVRDIIQLIKTWPKRKPMHQPVRESS